MIYISLNSCIRINIFLKLNFLFQIDAARNVTDVQCNCVYNQSRKCKHIAALIYFINNSESLSKTSMEQQWGKPSARKFAKNNFKGEYFSNMIPNKYTSLQEPQKVQISKLISDSPLKQILTAEANRNNFYTIKNVVDSLLTQVELNIEKEDCAKYVKNFLIFCDEHSIYTRPYELDENIRNLYRKIIELSEEDITALVCKTLGQSSCNDWLKAKRLRISASTNVHSIKTLTRKSVDSLVSDILYPKN